MPSNQYYHPGWEAVPLQMKEDPPSSSCMHESLPNNYGYPAPLQCHSCCTLGQHPAYYNFRLPCSHFSPPPPPPTPTYHHFCGGYLPYPQSHPMYYAPPPHYSMLLPRYEYDKSVPRDQFHCCGCTDHACHEKGRNNVKIEEQEPDVKMQKSGSVFPDGANNFPYPILWIPPEYTMNKDSRKASGQQVLPYVKKPQVQVTSTGTEAQENEGSPFGRKLQQRVQFPPEQDRNLKNGWFPLDMNRIKQLMEGGDAVQTRDQDNKRRVEEKPRDIGNEDHNKHFSYPIIWIPYDGRMEGCSKDQEDKSAGGTTVKEFPSASEVVPKELMNTDNEAENGKTAAGDDDSSIETLGTDKKSNVKIIPVKQLEDSVSKLSLKNDEQKVDRVPVSKESQDSAKHSSSPTKKSKLPPICLRVDPPKKKNGNGSSRSPSPPGDKKRQDFDESSSGGKINEPKKNIKVKDSEEKIPYQTNIEVSQGVVEAKEGSEILKDKATDAEKMVLQQADIEKLRDDKCGDGREQAQEPQVANEGEPQQESKQERKVMSDIEAAIIIQSTYRGYAVRRWEPLKKLKQITKVHEEAIQVKKHIEDLESRAAIDDKEKAAIGETIMNLLLKLDTIQGLHESIRDVRRSVAKELINLQEKLDAIMSQKSILLAQATPAAQAAKESLQDNGLVEGSEGIFVSGKESSQDSSLDSGNGSNAFDGEEISSNDFSSQHLPCQDAVGGSQNEDTLEEVVVNIDSQKGPQDEIVVSPTSDGVIAAANLGLEMMEKEPDTKEIVQGQFQECLVDASPIEDAVMVDGFVSGNKNQEVNMLSELPKDVVEDPLATVDSVENTSENKDHVMNQALELPQEVNGELLANVSINEEIAGPNDVVIGEEDHAPDIVYELPVEVVEVDEKESPMTECDMGSFKLVSPSDNSKEQIEMGQHNEKSEVGNEDNLVKEHENYDPLEGTRKETVSDQEAGSLISPGNIQLPLMEEVDNKPQELTTEEEVFGMEPGAQAEGEVFRAEPGAHAEEVVKIPHLREFEVEVVKENSGINNVECLSTTSHVDPFNNEEVPELLADDKENRSETVMPELLEPHVQSSVVGCEKDEQFDKKIIEENEKLREMLEKLLAAGKEQQDVISSLNGKVKDLEKKLAKKKNLKSAKHPRLRVPRSSCGKPTNGSQRARPMGITS